MLVVRLLKSKQTLDKAATKSVKSFAKLVNV